MSSNLSTNVEMYYATQALTILGTIHSADRQN